MGRVCGAPFIARVQVGAPFVAGAPNQNQNQNQASEVKSTGPAWLHEGLSAEESERTHLVFCTHCAAPSPLLAEATAPPRPAPHCTAPGYSTRAAVPYAAHPLVCRTAVTLPMCHRKTRRRRRLRGDLSRQGHGHVPGAQDTAERRGPPRRRPLRHQCRVRLRRAAHAARARMCWPGRRPCCVCLPCAPRALRGRRRGSTPSHGAPGDAFAL